MHEHDWVEVPTRPCGGSVPIGTKTPWGTVWERRFSEGKRRYYLVQGRLEDPDSKITIMPASKVEGFFGQAGIDWVG